MAEIKQKFSGDASALEREIERLKRQYEQMHDRVGKLGSSSKKSGDDATAMSQRMQAAAQSGVQAVRGWILQYVGLQQAIQQVIASIQHQRRVAEEAQRANLDVAGSHARVIKVIGRTTDEENDQFFQSTGAIQKSAGFESVVPINVAAAEILDATSGDRQKTLAVLEAAAPFFRAEQDQLGRFGSVIGDIMTATDGQMGAEQAVGLALALQRQGRFASTGGFNAYAQSLASVVHTVDTDRIEAARQSAAMFAAIGSAGGDEAGSMAKTGLNKLMKNMRAELMTAGVETSGLSLFDMVAEVQARPQIAQRVSGAAGRGAIEPIIRQLLSDPNSSIARDIQTAYQEIVADEGIVDEKRRQMQGGTQALRISSTSGKSKAALEEYRLSSGVAIDAEARQIFADTIKELGYFYGTAQRVGFEADAAKWGDTFTASRYLANMRDEATDPGKRAMIQGQIDALRPLVEASEHLKDAAAELNRAPRGLPAQAQSRSQDERE